MEMNGDIVSTKLCTSGQVFLFLTTSLSGLNWKHDVLVQQMAFLVLLTSRTYESKHLKCK